MRPIATEFAPPPAESTAAAPVRLVLDTNVVLDWLVFREPSVAALGAAIVAGRWQWIATPAMRDEFTDVVARGSLSRWRPDLAALQAAWSRWAQELSAGAAPLLGALCCTDPDDQKFIDFARMAGATALLSRDRAVLRLARRASRLGLVIATPDAWLASARPARH